MNVLLFRHLPESTVAALSAEFGDCTFRATNDPAQLEPWLAWPEVIFGNAPAAQLQRAPRLRWVQLVSSGFDDYRDLHGTPVLVTTGHGIHAPIIAQHVLLMFLLFVRGQLHFTDCQRRKAWDRRPSIPQDPRALTVGLVGCGAVGTAIAALLAPLGVTVLATRRSEGATPAGVRRLFPAEALDEMLPLCDHVVLTVPLTESTHQLMDARRLGLLKRGAVLHNIGRGALVNEPALIAQLRCGALGGAALDVFAEEPLPKANPLWELPNVVITPHLAGHHRDLGAALLERFKANLRRHLDGAIPEPTANFTRGY